jgi:hypothetical protein
MIKIYSLPAEVPAPEVDYSNFDHAKVQADEEQHMANLKAFLVKAGYNGKHTGEIYSEQVADGYALYMVADAKAKNFGLVHLPYGDRYQSRNVGFLTKAEILRRIEAEKKFRLAFLKA